MRAPASNVRKPVVGIMCCNEHWDRPVQAVATRFIKPFALISGVNPVLVPAVRDGTDVRSLAAALDGLMLTGSRSNVAPAVYGAPPTDHPTDLERDELALRLSGLMIERGKPVFGICRGLQELNTLFGGSLRDLHGDRHHAPENSGETYESLFRHRHEITLRGNGFLSMPVEERTASVSSAHHQAIDRLGHGLTVEAASDDGVIEAISAPEAGAAVLAVQWHPEVTVEDCPVSRGFYLAFRNAVYDASGYPAPPAA